MIPAKPKTMRNSAPEPEPIRAGHETKDAYARGVWITGVGLVVCTIAVMLTVAMMFRTLEGHHEEEDRISTNSGVAEPVSGSIEKFPGPRLQMKPEVDLATLRTNEDDQLNHYGWIDRKAGVVRLPIERAMDLIAQRGLPYRGEPDAPAPARTVLDIQQARPSDWTKLQTK